MQPASRLKAAGVVETRNQSELGNQITSSVKVGKGNQRGSWGSRAGQQSVAKQGSRRLAGHVGQWLVGAGSTEVTDQAL